MVLTIVGESHMKPASRTKSVGTKVTEEEHARLEVCASEEGLSISEWCRSVLLERTKTPKASCIDQIVLSEVLALRTILLNLHFAIAKGETPTAEGMQGLIERADQNKAIKAAERFAASCSEED